MADQARIPSYQELLARTDAPPGSSWGLFGADDELGSVNFTSRESVLAALGCVRTGQVIGLDHPLDAIPDNTMRPHPRHFITSRHSDVRDDYLDSFYLQGSSHIDGLRHRRHGKYGFYNGADSSDIRPDTSTLGVGAWGANGIVGRGVLLDAERFMARRGTPLDCEAAVPLGVGDLEDIAREQQVDFRPGDILVIRTGWLEYVLADPAGDYVTSGRWRHTFPGLEQSEEMLAWLWDHQFAVLAADNLALEVAPPLASSPFHADNDDDGFMHQHLIGLLGFVIGELWKLDELAEECAVEGRYDFLTVVKPLTLVGGVGSPSNAVAIR